MSLRIMKIGGCSEHNTGNSGSKKLGRSGG